MLEYLLIKHCSPTLAGIKTGSIFSCSHTDKEEIFNQIRQLNKILTPKGLRLLPVRFFKGKFLLYLYRPKMLRCSLNTPLASALLKQRGYNVKNCDLCVVQLINRVKCCKDFPHEIGLFLGYPVEDVQGFINSSRSGCKYVGAWKVYSDIDNAKAVFTLYNKCTELYKLLWAEENNLEQLAVFI